MAEPAGYIKRRSMPVKVDGEMALLTRFEKQSDENNGLYGEHISTVTTDDGGLKGFVKVDLKSVTADPKTLPQREHAKAIADEYLTEVAPDLLQDRRILWVDVHEETLQISHETDSCREVKTLGMKVKSRNIRTRLYFWVIVGTDEQVMVVERDIHWVVFPGKRGNRKVVA